MKVGVKWVIALGAVALGLGLLATCRRGDFTLPPLLTPMVIPQGRTTTKIITITRTDNFRGEVSFSIADAPPGLTARFSPETITSPGTQTTLTLTIGNQVPVGSYKIRIVAKSGNKTRETALEVRVEVGPDFSMATTPTRLTVKQGASGKTTVAFSRNPTFTGPITLTLEGAPAGVIGTFSPVSATGSASTLILAVAMPVAPGEYTLTIRGKGDGVEKLVPLSLVVEPSFGRLTISFPTEALGILHDWEKVEQIRDWIVHAFLVAREVPPEVIAVALHNQPPFRQPVLSEVHTWQYGIGRWVWVDDDPMDTEPGDLYTFLPEGADHRLVGGLADDFRRATGTIPTFVHLVTYAIDETAMTAAFAWTNTWAGRELFAVGGPFGYRERVIRTRDDLGQFLKEADDLVYVTVEGRTLRLGGRDLPNCTPRVTLEDAAALYQAYWRASPAAILASLASAVRQAYPQMSSSDATTLAKAFHDVRTATAKGNDREASQAAERAYRILINYRLTSEDHVEALWKMYFEHIPGDIDSVGFSLDPDPDRQNFTALALKLLELEFDSKRTGVTLEDWLLACLNAWQQNLLPLHRIMQTLRNGATEEARELYDMIANLLGLHACQCARYDGDIKGTQVGMTLFYCDLLAKLWMFDYEKLAPRHIGMASALEIPIASLFWEESWKLPGGRLWFGVNPPRVGQARTSLWFSPIATRVFMAADDPANRGKEVPPSELPEWMRLPNQCWEAQWPKIMDHEPEYFRLNQIMKFSMLIIWLQKAGQLDLLSFLDRESVNRTSTFEKWLEANRGRLTFKAWLPFTGEAAAGRECLSLLCSESHLSIGFLRFLQGGVSLASHHDSENLWKPDEYFAAMQGLLRDGRGRLTDLRTKATYTFEARNRVVITPGADARFRAPELELQLRNVASTWARTASNYRYSATWTCKTGQLLDETITFTQTATGIQIEGGGSAFAVQQLSQGLTEFPWEYLEAMYYNPKSGDLAFKLRAASGSFWLGTVRPQLGYLASADKVDEVEAASYSVGVQLLPQGPSEITTLPNVRQKVATSVEEVKKAPAACGIVDLEKHYLVITDRPDASLFMFPKDSQLAKVLTGRVEWPKSLKDPLWQVFLEPLFLHLFSTLPETVGFRFTDSEGEVKVVLETKARTVWPVLLLPEDMKRTLLDGRKIDVRLPPQGMLLIPESDPVLVETIYAS